MAENSPSPVQEPRETRASEHGQASIEWASLSDRALVRMFVQGGDEQAFRQLVERHAPLVLGTCRRGLNSPADADDAFQATFLVLARSAAKIRRSESLSAWLYGVATRICLRMRRDTARRSTQELMDTAADETDPLDELLARHDEMVADEELNALPAVLRTPLVLRFLAGKSNAQVAEELGITVAALEGRLKRGKQQLRMRLLRRGVTLAAVVATLKATRVVAGEVPAQLTESAVELCGSAASATISSLASEPTTSTHFALQELSAMNVTIVSKPILAAIALSGVVATVFTTQIALSQGDANRATGDFALHSVAAVSSDDPFESFEENATALVQQNRSDEQGSPDTSERNEPDTTSPETPRLEVRLNNLHRVVDLKRRSASELAIEFALEKPLSSVGLEFVGTPLSEVVGFLRDEYSIEIQIDNRSLEDLGLSADDPVTCNLRNITLESALNIMLSELELTYTIENEVLLIVNQDDEPTRLETRVYPKPSIKDFNFNAVMEVIAPDSWIKVGGEGTAVMLGDRWVVRQSYQVHREINALLSQLQDTEVGSAEDEAIKNAEMGIMDKVEMVER